MRAGWRRRVRVRSRGAGEVVERAAVGVLEAREVRAELLERLTRSARTELIAEAERLARATYPAAKSHAIVVER